MKTLLKIRLMAGVKRIVPLVMALLGATATYGQSNIDYGSGWMYASNQNIGGVTVDTVVMSGSQLRCHADSGQTLRVWYIDPSYDIVIVEMTGTGSLQLDMWSSPGTTTGITQPAGYNLNVAGTAGFAQGLPWISVTGADSGTNLNIRTIGPASTEFSSFFDINHQGGYTTGSYLGHIADVKGIQVGGTAISSILAGNARVGSVFSVAPIVNRLVVHGLGGYGSPPYIPTSPAYASQIYIDASSTLSQDGGYVLIAGGNIATNCQDGNALYFHSQNGTDSAGNTLTAQTISTSFYSYYTGSQIYPTITY